MGKSMTVNCFSTKMFDIKIRLSCKNPCSDMKWSFNEIKSYFCLILLFDLEGLFIKMSK